MEVVVPVGRRGRGRAPQQRADRVNHVFDDVRRSMRIRNRRRLLETETLAVVTPDPVEDPRRLALGAKSDLRDAESRQVTTLDIQAKPYIPRTRRRVAR